MSLGEVCKRFRTHLNIYYSRIKYLNPSQWPYSRFSRNSITLTLHPLPGFPVINDWRRYQIFGAEVDLTKPLDWFFSDDSGKRWPAGYYARINYRAGNPYGDVRINWELNRLQFLPAMAVTNEVLARNILVDWMENNPYLHGPGYLASMEVAIRWFSIYWAACLFEQPLESSLRRSLTGLAVASGKFIERHLSTHSSAGNHLIVEAVGLFWLGTALENNRIGLRWKTMSRQILWEQICRQINPDGTNQEQSFWYLGFVLDALFHYFLLEERDKIPVEVWKRVDKMLKFVDTLVLSDGSFPDYGDRDDGFIFRLFGNYEESPFAGLLNIGSYFYERPEWYRSSQQAIARLAFWTGQAEQAPAYPDGCSNNTALYEKPVLKTYEDGGMTLMQWGKGKLLFRHSRLGLDNTYGHGHADALAVLFYWGNVPVLIDLGSGQYNGDQFIRDFFRSTIAHNTVEIGGKNQAEIFGPFMWKNSYETHLDRKCEKPRFLVQASHKGYLKDFGIIHERLVEWPEPRLVKLCDHFSGPGGTRLRGAFHLGAHSAVIKEENGIEANFGHFILMITFPTEFSVEIFHGSNMPFIGWRSTIYGKWEPIYSIIYSSILTKDHRYTITLEIVQT